VRQRHSEEWVKKLDRPAWVLDIDNVLCDYTTGFCTWLKHRAPLFADAAQAVIDGRKFFSSEKDFGMTATEWQGFKHEFRSMGHKRQLPVMPGAREFTQELRRAGYFVILLTSRPIDRYPNIYTDTLWWLNNHGMQFDWVWWATDKGERLIENGGLKFIRGVVDDDPRYIAQFAKLGLQCWWLRTTQHPDAIPWAASAANVHVVSRLTDVIVEPIGVGVH